MNFKRLNSHIKVYHRTCSWWKSCELKHFCFIIFCYQIFSILFSLSWWRISKISSYPWKNWVVSYLQLWSLGLMVNFCNKLIICFVIYNPFIYIYNFLHRWWIWRIFENRKAFNILYHNLCWLYSLFTIKLVLNGFI